MITNWNSKAPSEEINVSFDFGATTAAVSSPVLTAALSWYAGTADINPSAILSGSPTVNGAVVTQKIIGGTDMNDYIVSCLVTTAEGEKLMVAAVLPVRTRP